MAYTSKDRGFHRTMLGTSVYSGNTKTAQSGIGRKVISASASKKTSFEDDYNERVRQKFEQQAKPIKLPEIFSGGDSPKKAITVTSGKKQSNSFLTLNNSEEPENAEQVQVSQGSKIRQKITELLKNKYGEPDTKHLFDDIDDMEIEKNIPVAKNTIKTNVDMGKLEKDYHLKLPNLADGLALSYAAADKGMNKAATKAREAAYMERKMNSFDPLTEMLKKRSEDKKSRIRYVKVDEGSNLNLRSAPGIGNTSLAQMPRGTQVDFTGNKVNLGNEQWAEVEYNGKKGWVDANYLKIDVPEDKMEVRENTHTNTPPNQNEEKTIDKLYKFNTPWFINKSAPLKAEDIQKKFNSVGDVDGNGLECPDLPKWFISEYTNLKINPIKSTNGNVFVNNIAETNNLTITNTPCAPSIFSIAGGTYGPGINENGVSDLEAGHTGIALACKKLTNGKYEITYIHTYNGLNENGYNSAIRTKEFSPSPNVTYVNIGEYLK